MRTIIRVCFHFMNLFYMYLSIIKGAHIYITNLRSRNYLPLERGIFRCVSLIIRRKAECVCLHIHIRSFLCCVKQIAEGLALRLLPAQKRNKSNFTPLFSSFGTFLPCFTQPQADSNIYVDCRYKICLNFIIYNRSFLSSSTLF